MKIFLRFLIVLYVALPSTLMALEVGKWSFEKADEYCYIGSLATESDLPSDKKRGDFYVLVYKNIGNPETVVQIEAGYNYKVPSDIIVNIDNNSRSLFVYDIPTTLQIINSPILSINESRIAPLSVCIPTSLA